MNDFKSYDALIERAALMVPDEVPEGKRQEFSRGFIRYLEMNDSELFSMLDGGAVLTGAERNRLNEQMSSFNMMVRKKKGLEHANA